ncbi:hypothetical protein E5K00_10320 [Hymenobacter aquaticus]|uniref:Outer membrane protein beta-barrel domain-containing protein n=1 Tax=Hymenobacter aquaticus TaxID=1867101 RepID=A0A4Z0Q800_9BACT|nr:hypothetical protein [Hymenobacter aquaticus]TGE25556.1 hypothetical protein E5K00_10320 [Hymenobacter aquaticus]
MPIRYPLAALCLLLGTGTYGQRPVPAPATDRPFYRLYAGAAAGFQMYQTVSAPAPIRYLNRVSILPAFVSVGYQLTPRLAVQAEFGQRDPADTNTASSGYTPDGRRVEAFDRRRAYDAAVPLLLRYRLTRRLNQAFHADALLGISTVFHVWRQEVSVTVDGQQTSYYLVDETRTNRYLTAGAALGVLVRRRYDVVLGTGVNQNVELLRSIRRHTLMPTLTLGLRYFLAPAKPA